MTRSFAASIAILVVTATAPACSPESSENSDERSTPDARSAAATPAERADESADIPGRLGSRVFVVQRDNQTLSVYDYHRRELLDRTIEGLGNLNHATMTFEPGLRYGFVASRDGTLTRIDLRNLERAGSVDTGDSSIDIAISRDGEYVATAQYAPGGVTILDSDSLEIVETIPATYAEDGEQKRSRATAIVDATGNRIVFSLMEGGEAWVVDAGDPELPVTAKIPLADGLAYDAMVTPDGRYYVVGHMKKEYVSVVDLENPDDGARKVSLRDPEGHYDPDRPVKLPHMASWAVAGDRVFVPLVGAAKLAVLDRYTWDYRATIDLRGDPVYAVCSPEKDEVWVSFSGNEDDAHVQVVDIESLDVTRDIEVGGRIYHMDFTPRGTYALVSANEAETLALVDTETYEVVDRHEIPSPSGIFGIWRAFQLGL